MGNSGTGLITFLEWILYEFEQTMKKDTILAIVLIAISLSSFYFFTQLATNHKLTGRDTIFLQYIMLSLGFLGSYIFGRQSSVEFAKEMVKPHARSALRRLLSLYYSISRVAEITDTSDPENIKIIKIQEIVREQIVTADDALADWQDIIPEAVEELREKGYISNGRKQDA